MRVGDHKGWGYSFRLWMKEKTYVIMRYYSKYVEYCKNDDRDHGMLIVSSRVCLFTKYISTYVKVLINQGMQTPKNNCRFLFIKEREEKK